jgi:hypothetical protein
MKVRVEFEFDEHDLGEKWMNRDNLEILLYTNERTKRDLLRITHYEEQIGNFVFNVHGKANPITKEG